MTKIRIKNIMTIFILITSFSVWILSLFISFQQESTKRKNLLNAEFISVTTQFEKNIDISLTFIHGLEGFTYSQIDKEIDTETFNTFSTVTQNPNNFIKNFSIAPNNIQVYVYPLEGNEVTLEHNLATDEREQVRNDVELAQSLKKSVISGPYELRQGGLGMVIRTPIFESDQYWGLVNVVVDLQKIIDLSFQIESGNLKYSIENMDGVFWPTQEVNAPLFKKEIIVEEDTWIVSASLTRKYDSSFIFNVFSNNLLIFLTIFIVTIFLVKILNKNILLSSRVKRLIYIDSLTNLPNRMMLMENLELLYQSKIEFGLAFIDLDNFKNINDNLGHKLGDRILTVLSTRFSTQQSINVYRWGGDEFILIGPNLNKESFTKKIQEIINNVSIPIIIDNKMFNIQVTTGITHTSSDGTDIDQLISKADLALNHAKTEKKGSIKIFDSTVSEKSAHFFKIEQELQEALRNHDLTVYYQPKLNIKTNKIDSVEALIRWFKSDGTCISPGVFLPVAKRSNLMAKIDDYVTKTVITQISEWNKIGTHLKVAINLSANQIGNAYISKIQEELKIHGVNPNQIEIEITESSSVENFENAAKFIKDLKLIGINVALDDFGTGYSSLSYLSKLEIAILKIDQEFIKKMDVSGKDYALIKSIFNIANNLNITTIAEGVEKLEQFNALKELGCDYIQGYLISKAVSSDEIIRLVNVD